MCKNGIYDPLQRFKTKFQQRRVEAACIGDPITPLPDQIRILAESDCSTDHICTLTHTHLSIKDTGRETDSDDWNVHQSFGAHRYRSARCIAFIVRTLRTGYNRPSAPQRASRNFDTYQRTISTTHVQEIKEDKCIVRKSQHWFATCNGIAQRNSCVTLYPTERRNVNPNARMKNIERRTFVQRVLHTSIARTSAATNGMTALIAREGTNTPGKAQITEH